MIISWRSNIPCRDRPIRLPDMRDTKYIALDWTQIILLEVVCKVHYLLAHHQNPNISSGSYPKMLQAHSIQFTWTIQAYPFLPFFPPPLPDFAIASTCIGADIAGLLARRLAHGLRAADLPTAFPEKESKCGVKAVKLAIAAKRQPTKNVLTFDFVKALKSPDKSCGQLGGPGLSEFWRDVAYSCWMTLGDVVDELPPLWHVCVASSHIYTDSVFIYTNNFKSASCDQTRSHRWPPPQISDKFPMHWVRGSCKTPR